MGRAPISLGAASCCWDEEMGLEGTQRNETGCRLCSVLLSISLSPADHLSVYPHPSGLPSTK